MSKSTIAELLRQYSKESVEAGDEGESNIEEGQVGAEEILVVTDEHTTELEEAIEEIADTVNQKVEAESALDNVLEATESLESAIRAIENARLQGHRVNGVAMQIWANGVVDSMEARQIPSEVFASLQEDYGSSFEADSYADYSVEATEKGEGILTKIWNMIKAAFAAVRDWFTRFLAWFGKSAAAIEKAGINLKKAAAEKRGKEAVETTIPQGPYSEFVKGGKFSPTEVVKSISAAIDSTATSARIMHTSLASAATKLESKSVSKQLITEINTAVADVNGTLSKVLGTAVTIELKTEISDKGSIKYKSTIKKTDALKGNSKVMTVSEVDSLADALESTGRSVATKLRELGNTMGKAGNINLSKDIEGEALKDARLTTRVIVAGTKIAQNLTSDVAKLTLPIAKKAYVLGMTSLRHYK